MELSDQLNEFLAAARAVIEYHECAPGIDRLQAAYEALTGERVFAYRDEYADSSEAGTIGEQLIAAGKAGEV
ncbi:hypothetical protein N5C16_00655 [Stenotrophomonas sp. GD03908]|uniref:hypothetical protein n=1 Tax=Stenotrophomonas sp. GD03908 TaxID=2975403 RepID=UPI00244B87E4|nr:hypothetical protein [Stenotrophomonas sp. GD03908]MDH0977776.1 hypothetical protein [Stenotrophomonas sp. GD03908]